MGTIRDLAYAGGSGAWRRYETNGVPGSGDHRPDKVNEIPAVFGAIEDRITALVGTQVAGYAVFDTKAHLDAALAYAANAGAAVYNDTVAANGIYRKIGASGSGSWTRLGPLSTDISSIDFNTQQGSSQSGRVIAANAVPVLTSGAPGQYPDAITSTFAGWATPIETSLVAFNAARFWYNIEQPGHVIRCSVWNAAGVLIAQADAVAYTQRGYVDIRFPAVASAASSIVWGSMHVPAGATRLRGYAPPSYVNVSAPATYPQKYMVTSDPQEDLANWQTVVGNTGFPIAFALYNYLTSINDVPNPDTLSIPPRLFGMVGLETNVYFDNLRSGQSTRAWNVDSVAGNGNQQDERWTFTPVGNVAADPVTVEVYEPDTLEKLGVGSYSFRAVTMSAASAAARRVLLIGDSLTAMARYPKRIYDLSAANASAVQVTLMGTQTGDLAIGGSISTAGIKHEGHSGYAISSFYQPSGDGLLTNPFMDGVAGHKFDASLYLSNTSQARPDIVVWELGPNDAFPSTSDAAMHALMDTALSQLDQMIGIQVASDVGSWLEVSGGSNIKHLICVPPPPAAHQEAFGANYGTGQFRARYRRNLQIFSWRMIDHYRGLEASKIFLVPLNAVVDPVNGFPFAAAAAANSQTSRTVERQTNALHALTTGSGGFEQIGDQVFSEINCLVVDGVA